MIKIKCLLLLLIFSGCGSNYYLKRAKINTYKALARGAKIDSIKEIVHDTIRTSSITSGQESKEVRIDTVRLQELCPEVTTKPQRNKLQKLVCPDVFKDTLYTFYATVDGKKYPISIHFVGSSSMGKAAYKIDVRGTNIPYVKTEVKTNVNPGKDGIKWYHLVLVGLACLVVGFIIGKVFSIGVKL